MLFEHLTFTLPNANEEDSTVSRQEHWSVVSSSSLSRTTFLQILAGQHISIPPKSRTYPYLSHIGTSPHHAIRYVGFDAERGSSVGGTSVRGAYLSARYESRREETDFSVRDYLIGHTELNPLEPAGRDRDTAALEKVTQQLSLYKLLDMPVSNLSNGQTRRARIAKALMGRPEVLLLDGPFMGLDPNTLVRLSAVLKGLAEKNQPRLVISLRPEDGIPEWISHLVVVGERHQMLAQGSKSSILEDQNEEVRSMVHLAEPNSVRDTRLSRDGLPRDSPALPKGEALVQMNGVTVSYGPKTVLGDWHQDVEDQSRSGLWWSLHRGQRCGIFGPNGSGKTTMLSLITSDHPQTYSLPIKLFGKWRLPGPGEPGISLFDIQKRMGHSSPEVHAFFPRQLTVRRALESAWADAPLSKPKLDDGARRRVDATLRWFASDINPGNHKPEASKALDAQADGKLQSAREPGQTEQADLGWARDLRFGELSFSSQRLVLFLRAVVAGPDLVILDEAFSGMDEAVRDRALLFLTQGEKIRKVVDGRAEESTVPKHQPPTMEGLVPHQALLVISHAREDVPGCVREWICLPEPGEGRAPRTGTLTGPLELDSKGWDQIWDRQK